MDARFLRWWIGLAWTVSAVAGWANPDPGDPVRDVLRGIGMIQGAVYDEDRQSVALIGDGRFPDSSPSPEQVAVALRWAFADEPGDPFVSIDPIPEDPEGPYMQIRIDDLAQDTEFGWVMFEADRLLKGYSLGMDSLSGVPVESVVPGYRNIFGWSDQAPGVRSGTPVWSRFWFRPTRSDVEGDAAAVRIVRCEIGVETEIMHLRNGKLESSGGLQDPAAEAFAAQFTEAYQAYADEEPVFRQLEQQCRLMLVSEWLRDLREAGLPVNLLWIAGAAEPEFPIPRYTPSLRVSRSRKYAEGDAMVTEMAQLFGGVDLEVKPRRVAPSTGFAAWKSAALTGLADSRGQAAMVPVPDGTLVAARLPGPGSSLDRPSTKRLLGTRLPDGPVYELSSRPLLTRRNRLGGEPGEEIALPVLRGFFPNGRRTADGRTGYVETIGVEGKPETNRQVRRYELAAPDGTRIGTFSEHSIDPLSGTLRVLPDRGAEPGWMLVPDPGNERAMWAVKDGEPRWAFLVPTGELLAERRGATQLAYRYSGRGLLERIETGEGQEVMRFEAMPGGARMASAQSGDGQVRDLGGARVRSEARGLEEVFPVTVRTYGHEHQASLHREAERPVEFAREGPGQQESARLVGLYLPEIVAYHSGLAPDVNHIHLVEAGGNTLVLIGKEIIVVQDRVTGLRRAANSPDRLGDGSAWKRVVEAVVKAIEGGQVVITGGSLSAAADLGMLVAAELRRTGSPRQLAVAENYERARENLLRLDQDIREWGVQDSQTVVLSAQVAEQAEASRVLAKWLHQPATDAATAARSEEAGVVFLLFHSTADIESVLATQGDLVRGKTVVCVACRATTSGDTNPTVPVAKVLKGAGALAVVNASVGLHAEAANRIMAAQETVSARGVQGTTHDFIRAVFEEARKGLTPGTPRADEILRSIGAMEDALRKPTAVRWTLPPPVAWRGVEWQASGGAPSPS